MKTYDVETLVDDLVTMFKAKLGAAITSINSEKGDTLLVAPDANAWFFQNLNDKMFNYEPFVFYAVDPILEQSNSASTSENVKISFEIALVDKGEIDTDSFYRKLLRYTRAFREVFLTNGRNIDSSVSMTIGSLSPLGIEVDGRTIKTAGIVINASIAS
jgi:hypothetical protein